MTPLILAELHFYKWAKDHDLSAADLLRVAQEIEDGLVDARLGGFLIKKRIASRSRGKSSGFRTIIAYRQDDRLIFLHGFAKSDSSNISNREQAALSKLANIYMQFDKTQIAEMVEKKLILEIRRNEPHS